MKFNLTTLGVWSAALALLLALLVLPELRQSGGSRYTRKVDENSFALGMEQLNGTIAESFSLRAGDTVEVGVVHVSGELVLSIGQENREAIYQGRNPVLNSFRVTVPEDGDYLFSMSGKRAEGSVSFQISRKAAG